MPPLRAAVEHGRTCRELGFDESAVEIWPSMHRDLDEEHFGILGAALRRGVPIVRRFAVIYALLDRESTVSEVHLRAAAAVWKYSVDSARYVLGDALGSRMADKLRQRLRESRGGWVTRAELRKAVGSNNIPAQAIEDGLLVLLDHGLVEQKIESTGGRPAELWRSTEAWEEWDESPSEAAVSSHISHSSYDAGVENGRPAPGTLSDSGQGAGDLPLASDEEEALFDRLSRTTGGER